MEQTCFLKNLSFKNFQKLKLLIYIFLSSSIQSKCQCNYIQIICFFTVKYIYMFIKSINIEIDKLSIKKETKKKYIFFLLFTRLNKIHWPVHSQTLYIEIRGIRIRQTYGGNNYCYLLSFDSCSSGRKFKKIARLKHPHRLCWEYINQVPQRISILLVDIDISRATF